MSSELDFVYKNPPLVEVIAEVRWELLPVSTFPRAALDPHFGELTKSISAAFAKLGYGKAVRLVPDGLPAELFAHKVIWRFQKAPQTWPLFQIGPGIFSANIVPPYEGWRSFAPFVKSGLLSLFESYPAASQFLKINHLELRYIDAFTEAHGMSSPGTFISKDLGLGMPLPAPILANVHADASDPIVQSGQLRLALQRPERSTGVISYDTGTANNRKAVVLTFSTIRAGANAAGSVDEICSWLDEAHLVTRNSFDALIPSAVKKTFGERRTIGK